MLPAGSSELAEEGARPKDARGAEDFYVRTFVESTFEVTGIQSGSPLLPRTVIPVEAIANVSLRRGRGLRNDKFSRGVEGTFRYTNDRRYPFAHINDALEEPQGRLAGTRVITL
jgi:hypothetical protein